MRDRLPSDASHATPEDDEILDDAAVYSDIRVIPVRRIPPCPECGCTIGVPAVRRENALFSSRLRVIAWQCEDCGRTQTQGTP